MDFKFIEDFSASVANLTFLSLDRKETVRDSIIRTVAEACIKSENDREFRNQMKEIAEVYRQLESKEGNRNENR
jgi:carbamate kinase